LFKKCSTGDPGDSTRARRVGVSKNGKIYAVGMIDGTIKTYKAEKDGIFEMDKNFKRAKREISTIQFNAKDTMMAFG
jgi:hypothetical protein